LVVIPAIRVCPAKAGFKSLLGLSVSTGAFDAVEGCFSSALIVVFFLPQDMSSATINKVGTMFFIIFFLVVFFFDFSNKGSNEFGFSKANSVLKSVFTQWTVDY
jgi:hypothetical protein